MRSTQFDGVYPFREINQDKVIDKRVVIFTTIPMWGHIPRHRGSVQLGDKAVMYSIETRDTPGQITLCILTVLNYDCIKGRKLTVGDYGKMIDQFYLHLKSEGMVQGYYSARRYTRFKD